MGYNNLVKVEFIMCFLPGKQFSRDLNVLVKIALCGALGDSPKAICMFELLEIKKYDGHNLH